MLRRELQPPGELLAGPAAAAPAAAAAARLAPGWKQAHRLGAGAASKPLAAELVIGGPAKRRLLQLVRVISAPSRAHATAASQPARQVKCQVGALTGRANREAWSHPNCIPPHLLSISALLSSSSFWRGISISQSDRPGRGQARPKGSKEMEMEMASPFVDQRNAHQCPPQVAQIISWK